MGGHESVLGLRRNVLPTFLLPTTSNVRAKYLHHKVSFYYHQTYGRQLSSLFLFFLGSL